MGDNVPTPVVIIAIACTAGLYVLAFFLATATVHRQGEATIASSMLNIEDMLHSHASIAGKIADPAFNPHSRSCGGFSYTRSYNHAFDCISTIL
jgi:hypothetical protein